MLFIMLGGYYATLNYKNLLETLDIDCCVCGEGEENQSGTAAVFEPGASLSGYPGIAYKKDGHAIKKREPSSHYGAGCSTIP